MRKVGLVALRDDPVLRFLGRDQFSGNLSVPLCLEHGLDRQVELTCRILGRPAFDRCGVREVSGCDVPALDPQLATPGVVSTDEPGPLLADTFEAGDHRLLVASGSMSVSVAITRFPRMRASTTQWNVSSAVVTASLTTPR